MTDLSFFGGAPLTVHAPLSLEHRAARAFWHAHRFHVHNFQQGDSITCSANSFSGVTALLLVATTAFSQDGSVVSVNTDKKQIEVKVGDKKHVVDVADVELLDSEGKEAKLGDFSKDDAVKVTIEKGSVTVIQLAKEESPTLVRRTEPTTVSRGGSGT